MFVFSLKSIFVITEPFSAHVMKALPPWRSEWSWMHSDVLIWSVIDSIPYQHFVMDSVEKRKPSRVGDDVFTNDVIVLTSALYLS